MEKIEQRLKRKYQISNYQMAQLNFFFKTIFSELSKMLIMGVLFHRHLNLYLMALFVMLFMRCLSGGLHFYTYWGCLVSSILYMWLAIYLLPHAILPSYLQLCALLTSFLICYLTGPVVSKYRPEPSLQHSKHCINLCCTGIFVFAVILYIIPENRAMTVGLWVIILHSLQLLAAKIRKKGGHGND